jgi:hypothetical protein
MADSQIVNIVSPEHNCPSCGGERCVTPAAVHLDSSVVEVTQPVHPCPECTDGAGPRKPLEVRLDDGSFIIEVAKGLATVSQPDGELLLALRPVARDGWTDDEIIGQAFDLGWKFGVIKPVSDERRLASGQLEKLANALALAVDDQLDRADGDRAVKLASALNLIRLAQKRL